MESIVLWIMAYSALFGLQDAQYSSFEVGQLAYKKNTDSLEVYNNNEFSNFKNITLGSRSFDRYGDSWSLGYASYLFGSKEEQIENARKLHMYGGYIGYLVEYTFAKFLSLGLMAGGGSTIIEYNDTSRGNHKIKQYFGYASPYLSIAYPLHKDWSLSLTGSTYFLAEPSRKINGTGDTYLAGKVFSHKLGIEIIWKN